MTTMSKNGQVGSRHFDEDAGAALCAGFRRANGLWLATMFDTIKSGITTATEKLTHLRRFL